VVGLESHVIQTRETSVRLANVDDELLGAGKLLADRYAKQAVLELGYWDGASERKGPILVGDISEVARSRFMPRNALNLRVQGRLNLLNHIQSSLAHEWPSQAIGGDNFWDPTDTGYGGLKHWAPQIGRWYSNTEGTDYELWLFCDNEEGVGFSTLVMDMFCGEVSGSIEINESDKGEYAGICFWAQDYKHLWYAVYDGDSDKIKLVRRVVDQDSEEGAYDEDTKAESGAMGWSIGTTYWLKVILDYALIKVYSSPDGCTWTEEISYERYAITNVSHNPGGEGVLPLISGRVGFIGKGYLESDEHDVEDDGEPPDPDIPKWPDELPPEGMALGWDTAKVGWTEGLIPGWGPDWGGRGPHWVDVTGALTGTIIWIIYITTGDDTVGAWALTSTGAWWAEDVLTSSITWTCKLTLAQMRTAIGDAGASFSAIHGWTLDPDYCIILVSRSEFPFAGTYNQIIRTYDLGETWSVSSLPTYGGGAMYHALAVDENTGHVYCVTCEGPITSVPHLFRSFDEGATWTHRGYLSYSDLVNPGDHCRMRVPLMQSGLVYIHIGSGSGSNEGLSKWWDPDGTETLITPAALDNCLQLHGGIENYPWDADRCWATGVDASGVRHLWVTDDGGDSWTSKFTISGRSINKPGGWPGDPDIIWLTVTGGGLPPPWYPIFRYTDDGGVNWYSLLGDWNTEIGSWVDSGHNNLLPLPRIGPNAP
jgi:hypothetical protein